MEWIKTEDRLPKEERHVFIAFVTGSHKIIETDAFLRGGEWYFVWDKLCPACRKLEENFYEPVQVTHWMEHPEPPKD